MPFPSATPGSRIPELEERLDRLYLHYGGRGGASRVEFYPYAGLSSTIRVRDGRPVVRISDLLEDAPGEVLEALLHDLVARLFGKRPPASSARCYTAFIRRPELRDRARQARRRRGRKQMLPPRGEVHDLGAIFERLNREHFGGGLELRGLGWSVRRSRSRLGHFDPAHETIVLDRRLDNPLVPEHVVAFVLYHEMLHARLGEELTPDGRRRIHHPEFRAAERSFPGFERARRFLRSEFG